MSITGPSDGAPDDLDRIIAESLEQARLNHMSPAERHIASIASETLSPTDELDILPDPSEMNLSSDELFCHLLRPGGNDTVLVETANRELTKEQRIVIGRYFVRNGIAEQVGFLLSRPHADAGLQMADDELCLNGLGCAGALAYMRRPEHQHKLIDTPSSERPIEADCREAEDPRFINTKLSFLSNPRRTAIDRETHIVDFGGIAHILREVPEDPALNKAENRARLKAHGIDDYNKITLQHAREVKDVPALGVIFHQWIQGDRSTRIQPIVGVGRRNLHDRLMDQIVMETACGSGTVALGMKKFLEDERLHALLVKQPSDSKFNVTTQVDIEDELVVGYLSVLESDIEWLQSFRCRLDAVLR